MVILTTCLLYVPAELGFQIFIFFLITTLVKYTKKSLSKHFYQGKTRLVIQQIGSYQTTLLF